MGECKEGAPIDNSSLALDRDGLGGSALDGDDLVGTGLGGEPIGHFYIGRLPCLKFVIFSSSSEKSRVDFPSSISPIATIFLSGQ